MLAEKKLYEAIIKITEDYLGPAGQRFIDRQINDHLQKEPGKLNKQELERLSEWARLAFALLTNDQTLLEEYSKRLERLKVSGTAE